MKKPKKKGRKYEKKLVINASFEEVMDIAIKPKKSNSVLDLIKKKKA